MINDVIENISSQIEKLTESKKWILLKVMNL